MAKKKTPPDTSATSAAPRRRAPAKTTAIDQRELAGVNAPAAAAAADASASMPAPVTLDPSYDEIAEAAYRRYLSRGGSHGRDFDDWIEAERELRSR